MTDPSRTNDKPPTKPPTTTVPPKTLPPIRTRQDRAYQAWQLRRQGIPTHEIAHRLKARGFSCSERTIERDLADMRAKHKIDRATMPDLYDRGIPESVDEKTRMTNRLWEIIDQPPAVDEEGRAEDRSFIQVQAIKVAALISRDLDKLYGLDLASLREKIDEFEKRLTLIESPSAPHSTNNGARGTDSSQPSSGSSSPRSS